MGIGSIACGTFAGFFVVLSGPNTGSRTMRESAVEHGADGVVVGRLKGCFAGASAGVL
jgi:hypothetical protein